MWKMITTYVFRTVFKIYKVDMALMLCIAFTFTGGRKSNAGFLCPDNVFPSICLHVFIFRKHSKSSDSFVSK